MSLSLVEARFVHQWNRLIMLMADMQENSGGEGIEFEQSSKESGHESSRDISKLGNVFHF